MSNPLLKVGITVIHGLGSEGLSDEQADELVKNNLRLVNIEALPVRCALLLATADWCQATPTLPAKVYQQLKDQLGYEVPLIGGSMAGFYCSTEPDPFVPHGIMLLLLCSNHLWVSVGHLRDCYAGTGEERRRRLGVMAQKLVDDAGVRLGASADRSLIGILPGIVSDARGDRAYFDNELYQEILEAFEFRYPLVGASAADKIEPQVGYQFANDIFMKSGLAIACVESDLSSAAMMTHGFKPLSHTRVSVDALAEGASSGYDVTQLDGRAAATRLQELASVGSNRLGKPVFGLPCGTDFNIIWPHQIDDRNGGTIRLKRKVSLGDQLYVLNADPEHMLKAGDDALKGVIERACVNDISELSLIIGFSCVGRISHYAAHKADWREVINHLREAYVGIPLVWALSAGEFGIDEWRRTRANNMSISTICLTNVYSRRAGARHLQNRLLAAGSRLATCITPSNVMEVALNGAVEAGATGGQICIVDHKLGRIIGKEFGYALQAPNSPHDWPAVAELTDRPITPNIDDNLPVYLEHWAMPVTADPSECETYAKHNHHAGEGEREDILPLIVRTLHAVFIPNSSDPKFHCNHKAVKEGNLECQLAIPLVGSYGRAIATLQVSFPESKPIDRESLALWVGYAQNVATALDRAQEVEERNILGLISRYGGEVMQSQPDVRIGPWKWCKNYLTLVMRLLGADGGHIRTLIPNSTNSNLDEHMLITAVGHLSDLLHLTRPVIHKGDGSYDLKILEGGGVVSNTKKETAAIIKDVKAIKNKTEYGPALTRELGKVESLAIMPLCDQKMPIGSLDIYSKRKYFFTERRERIIRAAARLAGDILRAKTAEYDQVCTEMDRKILDEERQRVLNDFTIMTEGAAEQRLRALLARVCQKLEADVASVFIWYDAPKKLILYAGYNWHDDRMEGRAAYERGEGWVGTTAFGKEDISIVLPSSDDARHCKLKYYEHMIPPEHRIASHTLDPRIGIRLTIGQEVVGFASFSYYRENIENVITNNRRTMNYLRDVGPLITMDVEAVKKEIRQKQMEQLTRTKEEVASAFSEDSDVNRDWQPILNTICNGFQVKRVSFYYVRPDKKYHLAWSSPADEQTTDLAPVQATEPVGAMADIILRKEELLIRSGKVKDARLERWPNSQDIKSLFAIPVITTKGSVCGVLEYVNRKSTPDHPFDIFDTVEKHLAKDVAMHLASADEQREHDKTLLQLRSRLMTATKIGASGLYSALVMHQVMTPFALMRAAIDWLKRHPDSSEEERMKHLSRIERDYSRAVESIKQAAHRKMPSLQRISVRTVVGQALRAVKPEIPPAGIIQHVNNDLNIPVYVNLWAIVGALVNLLSNALDAMRGSGVLTVWTELAEDRRNVIIHIHNTGPSLTQEDIVWLFQPGSSTKLGEEQNHLGLGLPLAKQAIDEARGKLHIEPSPPRGGVEVTVTLPVADDYQAGAAMAEDLKDERD